MYYILNGAIATISRTALQLDDTHNSPKLGGKDAGRILSGKLSMNMHEVFGVLTTVLTEMGKI